MADKTSDTPRTDDISLSQEVVEECREALLERYTEPNRHTKEKAAALLAEFLRVRRLEQAEIERLRSGAKGTLSPAIL